MFIKILDILRTNATHILNNGHAHRSEHGQPYLSMNEWSLKVKPIDYAGLTYSKKQ